MIQAFAGGGGRVSHLEPEWMDDPHADPQALLRSLKFIRRVNFLLGYTRVTLRHLERISRSWKPGERIRMVDLGTGSADIPLAILRWADRRGFDILIVGLERHGRTAAMAVGRARGNPRLKIVQGDVLQMPLADGAFDYALTAMFLHHLTDAHAVAVLKAMNRLARRGVIVADLLRNRRAYACIKLFTAFSNPMVRHDAALSVLQAFDKAEAIELARGAGLDYLRYHRHFGYRFALVGEK